MHFSAPRCPRAADGILSCFDFHHGPQVAPVLMVAAATGLAGDAEVALPKAGLSFLSERAGEEAWRTEPEKDLGLLTPDAAGHRLGRGRAGMFSLVPLSAQHTGKPGAVKILRIPENSGEKTHISLPIIFPAFTSLNILQP